MNSISILPPSIDLETKAVLKKLPLAHRFLAELKGISHCIPNNAILLNTLSLQEAKDSSAVENIITTHDELYKESLFNRNFSSVAAKEVKDYANAILYGFAQLQKNGSLTCNDIKNIQQRLEKNDAGFRNLPGTKLINDKTGEIVYVPPQDHDQIIDLMVNLECVINNDMFWPNIDPLIKMVVIHYQFESIHPFFDGNGRTGRILNVLYLVLKELLDIPILYLSRYIIRNKDAYYQGLQKVRTEDAWEQWILFILDAIIDTSKSTTLLVKQIEQLHNEYKRKIRDKYKFYSRDLVDALFMHPYTKITTLAEQLKIGRATSKKYLELLCNDGFLTRHKFGNYNYYVNHNLFSMLSDTSEDTVNKTNEHIRTIN